MKPIPSLQNDNKERNHVLVVIIPEKLDTFVVVVVFFRNKNNPFIPEKNSCWHNVTNVCKWVIKLRVVLL